MKLPTLTPSQFRLVGIVIIVGLVALGAYLNQKRSEGQTQVKLDYGILDTRVVWTDEAFRIVNLENRSWRHCAFVLNKRYTFIREKVQPREVLQIAHSLFEDNRGNGYVFAAEDPTSFTIRCEDVGGRVGLFSGSYSEDSTPR